MASMAGVGGRPDAGLLARGTLMGRERIVARLTATRPDATVVLGGAIGDVAADVVQLWSEQTGAPTVWLDVASDAAPDSGAWQRFDEVLGAAPPGLIAVLRVGHRASGDAVSAVAQRLQQAPRPVRVVIVGASHSTRRRSRVALRPDVVITARELCLTVEELAQVAQASGVALREEDVERAHRWTGGHPVAVDCLVHAVDGGPLTPAMLDAAADLLADRLSTAVAAGDLPADVWGRVLRAAVPEYFTADLLEEIAPAEGQEPLLRMLDAEALIRRVERGDVAFAFAPMVRAALIQRLRVELPPDERERLAGSTAGWLVARGDLEGAISTATTLAGARTVAGLIAPHWAELGALRAGRVRFLLTRLAEHVRSDPRLLVAHVRSIVDVTHTDHPGSVSATERVHAGLLLDAVDDSGDEDVAVAVRSLRAVLARLDGRHEEALSAHDAVVWDAPRARRFAVPGLVQQALTLMRHGRFTEALQLVTHAEALLMTHRAVCDRGYVRGLATLLRHLALAHDPPSWAEGAPQPTERGGAEALVHHKVALDVLDPAAVRTLLGRSVSAGNDPLVLRLLELHLSGVAHVVAGTAGAGLEAVAAAEDAVPTDQLTAFERQLIDVTRAELLVADGDAEAALRVLDAMGDALQGVPGHPVRAQALLDLGRAAEALDLVRPLAGSTTSRHRVWNLVLTSLGLRACGRDAEADRYLHRSVATGARAQAMLPFARTGHCHLEQLLERAGGLRLEEQSREFVAALGRARESLRLLTERVHLTEREQMLLQHLVHAPSARRLAAALYVSPNTVKSQLRSIYRKLSVSSREDAITAARVLGLLPHDG